MIANNSILNLSEIFKKRKAGSRHNKDAQGFFGAHTHSLFHQGIFEELGSSVMYEDERM
jgi:hypothetical protein